MIRTLKITASLAILATAGACHAQELSPLVPMQRAAVVAAQTSSPTNYAILQPIANKPLKRQLRSAELLQPMTAVAAVSNEPNMSGQSDGLMASPENGIVVTPLSFKRDIFDEHEFKVLNTTNQPLRKARIVLTAPVGSVVQQVSPKPDSVDGGSIVVTVDQIAPGEHKVINVAINYPRNEFARFESMVINESWGQNSLAGTTADVTAKQVSDSDLPAETLQPEMLQPKSTAMLEPRPPLETGILKPKVPAISASATTKRAVEGQSSVASNSAVETMKAATTVDEESLDDSAVKSYFQGPENVVSGEVNDYRIDIQNLSSETAQGIIVQLSIPQKMKVTMLDRDAWYDAKNRKVTWQLDRLDGRAIETIQYKAIAKKPSSIEQLIVVGMDSKVQSTSSLKTIAR